MVIQHEKAKDLLAALVIDRFKSAYAFKTTHTHYQGKTPQKLIEEANHSFNKRFTPEFKSSIKKAYGSDPTRYFGLVQLKVNAFRAWKRDLVFSNLDKIFTVYPTPNPTLDETSLYIIQEDVKQQMVARLMELGIFDPSVIATDDGQLPVEVMNLIDQYVKKAKAIETSRVVGKASSTAKLIDTALQDILVESNFRQEYGKFTQSQALYGIAFMRFPAYRPVVTYEHAGKSLGVKGVIKSKPLFSCIDPLHMFPTADGQYMSECAGVTEVQWLTKYELIRMMQTPETEKDMDVEQYKYSAPKVDASAIRDVLEEYAHKSRSWIELPYVVQDTTHTFWDMDGAIPALRHEGFVSGRELSEYGVTGYDDYEYVNTEILVVGARVVSLRILKSPQGEERSYYATPFIRTGSNIWDAVGMAGMLKDTEDRINRLMYAWEDNIEWATRPTYAIDPDKFQEPTFNLQAGGVYMLQNDQMLLNASNTPAVSQLPTVSAQYNLIWQNIQALLRSADEECGVPAYAYSAANYGKASLGEYAQRMSNALRTVKEAAVEEDATFIEPAFTMMYRRLMRDNKHLVEGQDIDLQVRGVTGLVANDEASVNSRDMVSSVLSLSEAAPTIITEEVKNYAVYSFLRSAGVPLDALGVDNPVVENAMDLIAARGVEAPPMPISDAFATQDIPTLDGRSGAMPADLTAQGGDVLGIGGNQYNTVIQ